MLSDFTLTAIAVLKDISEDSANCTGQLSLDGEAFSVLLYRLETNGLIQRKASSLPAVLSSYRLSRPYAEISLLDILEATGEHLDCNRPADESLYNRYHLAAKRLGIVNYMTRLYLSEINLTDL